MAYGQNYFSGLSGLVLDRPKYLFPEPYRNASRLTYYSTIFNSIEINSSFYKIPLPATTMKWASSVNEQFRFTFKLFKEITHSKGLLFTEELITKFFATVNNIKDRQGCILIQFPPTIGIEHSLQFEQLLKAINKNNYTSWNIAVEFRNKTWYNEKVYDLLDHYSAALVIHDMPGSSSPMIDPVGNFIYLRFHGPAGGYRGSYSEELLQEYASYIKEWLNKGMMVYIYFNNTAGDAFNNLKTLNDIIYAGRTFDHIV